MWSNDKGEIVMRYVRTKDGNIYEIIEDRQDGVWLVVKEHKPNNYNFKLSLMRVLKQADIIEELCDVFIVKGTDIDANENCYLTLEYCPKLSQIILHPRHSIEIYGAIWTDKGLIYVAKMNEKGELELL